MIRVGGQSGTAILIVMSLAAQRLAAQAEAERREQRPRRAPKRLIPVVAWSCFLSWLSDAPGRPARGASGEGRSGLAVEQMGVAQRQLDREVGAVSDRPAPPPPAAPS